MQDVSVIRHGVERVATYVVQNGMAQAQIKGNPYFLRIRGIEPVDAVAQLLTSLINACTTPIVEKADPMMLEPHAKTSECSLAWLR